MILGLYNRRRGFTLVEVLASLAFVGAILPAALAGVSLAMNLGETARDRTEAAQLAEARLAEVVATGQWLEGEEAGDFGEQWERFTWQMKSRDWEEPGLAEVTVSVLWTSRDAERTVDVTTLVYPGDQ